MSAARTIFPRPADEHLPERGNIRGKQVGFSAVEGNPHFDNGGQVQVLGDPITVTPLQMDVRTTARKAVWLKTKDSAVRILLPESLQVARNTGGMSLSARTPEPAGTSGRLS